MTETSRKPLRCPECNGQIETDVVSKSNGNYVEYDVNDGFYCLACKVEWDLDGLPRLG